MNRYTPYNPLDNLYMNLNQNTQFMPNLNLDPTQYGLGGNAYGASTLGTQPVQQNYTPNQLQTNRYTPATPTNPYNLGVADQYRGLGNTNVTTGQLPQSKGWFDGWTTQNTLDALNIGNQLLGTGMNAWLGMEQLDLARDNYNLQKDAFNKNYAAQLATTNNDLYRQYAKDVTMGGGTPLSKAEWEARGSGIGNTQKRSA